MSQLSATAGRTGTIVFVNMSLSGVLKFSWWCISVQVARNAMLEGCHKQMGASVEPSTLLLKMIVSIFFYQSGTMSAMPLRHPTQQHHTAKGEENALAVPSVPLPVSYIHECNYHIIALSNLALQAVCAELVACKCNSLQPHYPRTAAKWDDEHNSGTPCYAMPLLQSEKRGAWPRCVPQENHRVSDTPDRSVQRVVGDIVW